MTALHCPTVVSFLVAVCMGAIHADMSVPRRVRIVLVVVLVLVLGSGVPSTTTRTSSRTIFFVGAAESASDTSTKGDESVPKKHAPGVPPSWEVLPIPRFVDYGSPKQFIAVKNVAIVRRKGSPYQTVRDGKGNLVGQSTIVEQELTGILKENGVARIDSLDDNLKSYDGYDTLILLGNPQHNTQTEKMWARMKLSFDKWDASDTPEDDFAQWKDFGREGYLLKVGRLVGSPKGASGGGKNIIIVAGYDYDDARREFCGAGTFYASQSLRQLIVKDGRTVKIKTAEIADKPLLEFRGCMTGSPPSPEQNWRDVSVLPLIKANANIYWYGHAVAEYCTESAAKFRYPWRPEQLEFFAKIGKWCREHYVTMVFCLNPDHYNVAWATAMTLDGKERDPLHYDPDHQVEAGFKLMWAELGYEVKNDVDVLAAKFSQMNKAVGGGAMLQMMNEDDLFGLVHPEDKKLFNTETGDSKQDAVNYGRARAQFLAALYRRVREMCPDSSNAMPICPPGQVCYQRVLETNEYHSRDFLESLTRTLKKLGLLESMPVITTGGGTFAEVITDRQISNFKRWCNAGPVILHENNFVLGHVGAYETDPSGPRSHLQKSDRYPAGYRDKELFKRLWGITWNGLNDVHALAWCQGQYMWNMLAADREKVNALATRKVSSAESYPLVKAFYEEFDRPTAYLPDDGADQIVAISDGIAFPGKGWDYQIICTDDLRLEAQRLRDRLALLIPKLEVEWQSEFEKPASLRHPGYDAYNFCCVYLARGYITGWKDESGKPVDKLGGERLRDLYLEAEDIQQRYFAGPEVVAGNSIIDRNFYVSSLNRLYVGRLKQPANSPAESPYYVDIWKEGLLGEYFEPVSSIVLSELADGDETLATGWGKVEEADKEEFRTATGEAILKAGQTIGGRLLIRARLGTGAANLTEAKKVTLSIADSVHQDAVCKPRWITWLLPSQVRGMSQLAIKADKPVRVYAIEIFKEREGVESP